MIGLYPVALTVGGCEAFARSARQYTYPPEFRYISRDQLMGAMWQLAYHWREVNRLLRASERPFRSNFSRFGLSIPVSSPAFVEGLVFFQASFFLSLISV